MSQTASATTHGHRAVLEAAGLTKVYGSANGTAHTALDGFDLRILPGEFLGVMGPSGSGKTTLLNMLATIDSPTAGSLRIAGADPSGMRPTDLALFRRRRLGFVFQEFNLLDTLTVRENILLPLVLDNVKVDEMERRLASVTERLGIGALLERRPYEISGGQQQRVAIARAIIPGPDLVLADELTGNLDSKSALDVMRTLQGLNDDGVTVVMVTHDPFAASFCKRIVFIKDGNRFGELVRGVNRQAFFQQVLDALSVMGGGVDDVQAART
ncbi:MAG: ABC transporter ATP-binding protein [Trueperaceae bacterium]|nr:ABC transporter ATP-binding protein [Trueperaceae bacterium]MCC6310479.1 ABC transporter ATP-binding protein [Trueperaceae bacterium]MCO5173400.1 ABC transporter ATP-binding protein [Trueperaceae bacterium]MCW5819235.1 ABC transporter ATP-binding protein [Trueperaceae bacterium]